MPKKKKDTGLRGGKRTGCGRKKGNTKCKYVVRREFAFQLLGEGFIKEKVIGAIPPKLVWNTKTTL